MNLPRSYFIFQYHNLTRAELSPIVLLDTTHLPLPYSLPCATTYHWILTWGRSHTLQREGIGVTIRVAISSTIFLSLYLPVQAIYETRSEAWRPPTSALLLLFFLSAPVCFMRDNSLVVSLLNHSIDTLDTFLAHTYSLTHDLLVDQPIWS